MTDQAPSPGQTGSMMSFRSRAAQTPRLPEESARRQGRITKIAFLLLGGRDGAIAFLNTRHDDLGGRPIDLAIASDEGFALVEQVIEQTANSTNYRR